jgi:hypothetical protein
MMDIPVRLCEFSYKVLSAGCFNPVRQFLNAEIFYFLPYDAAGAQSSGIITADADSNICSNSECLFKLIIQVGIMRYLGLNYIEQYPIP